MKYKCEVKQQMMFRADKYRQYMCTLSADIKFICKNFINRKKREPLTSFSGLFHNENIYILHLFSIVSSLMSVLIYCYCVLPLIYMNQYNWFFIITNFIISGQLGCKMFGKNLKEYLTTYIIFDI